MTRLQALDMRQRLLELIRRHPDGIKLSSIRTWLTDFSPSQLGYALFRLRDEGLIVMSKYAHYRLAQQTQEQIEKAELASIFDAVLADQTEIPGVLPSKLMARR